MKRKTQVQRLVQQLRLLQKLHFSPNKKRKDILKKTQIESVRELDSIEMVDSTNHLIKAYEKKGWQFVSMANDFSKGIYVAILTFQKEVEK